MNPEEGEEITCEHERRYHERLRAKQSDRRKREEEITKQARALAKKILKKKQNESMVDEKTDCKRVRLPPIDASAPMLDQGQKRETEEQVYPHSAFCRLSSSSSEVSELSFDDRKYDELKLPVIKQRIEGQCVTLIEDSVQEVRKKQKYPLTLDSLLTRTAQQRLQERLESRVMQKDIEKKMVSIFRLKESMKKDEARLSCHQYERGLQAESDLDWVQLGMAQRIDINRLGIQKDNIFSKYRKLHKEREESKKKRLKRKIDIVKKLLREEEIKHGVKTGRAVRKLAKRDEVKASETEGVLSEHEEELGNSDDQEQEGTPEEKEVEEEVLVSQETTQNQVIEGEIKDENKKKKSGKGKESKGKTQVEGGKKGKARGKSKSPKSTAKSSSKAKKERKKADKKGKKKAKPSDANATSQEILEPIEKVETQFPCLMKMFEEWEKQKPRTETLTDDLSMETGVEWRPNVIMFKDFIPLTAYKQRLHVVNTSSQKVHCRFDAVQMDNDLDCEVLQVDAVDAVRLTPGMSWAVDVRFHPEESTWEVTGRIRFVTRHLDTRKQFLVPFEATPCRAQPSIQPLELIFPTCVFWRSLPATRHLKVENRGGADCKMTLRKTRDVSGRFVNNLSIEDKVENSSNEDTKTEENNLSEGANTVKEDNKSEDRPCSEWKTSPCLWVVRETIEEMFDDVFAVFRIQPRHYLHVPAHGEISVPVRFFPQATPFAGKFLDKYEAIFEGDGITNLSQEILIRGETEDVPITVSPSVLDMKLCYIGGNVQQENFTVSSKTNLAISVLCKVPNSLSKHVQADPKETVLQSHSSLDILVRLALRQSICSDAGGYFDDSTGILEFPIEVNIRGSYEENPPPISVTAIALVSSACSLSIRPECIDLGQVSTFETVTTELQLTNHSSGLHEFLFVNLPASVGVEPGGGTGQILPGETLRLQMFYSPSVKDICSRSCSIGCQGQHDFTLQCVTALGQALGLQKPPLLHQVKSKSLSFSEKSSFTGEYSDVTVLAGSEERLGTESNGNQFQEEGDNTEDVSRKTSETSNALSTDLHEMSLKQALEGIIKMESFHSEDNQSIWHIYNSFEIGKFKENEDFEVMNEQKMSESSIMYVEDVKETSSGSDVPRDTSVLEPLQIGEREEVATKEDILFGKIHLDSEKEVPSVKEEENPELDWLDAINSGGKMTQSDPEERGGECGLTYSHNSPTVNISAYVVDPFVELSAQKLIFPPTPCESFFISYIYLRSRKQEGCHCGLVKPNAHSFAARFEFKWNCDQISVEPRRGEISVGQSVKIALIFKPRLRVADVLNKAKELKTEKLYEEYINAFVKSHKNKKKKKLKKDKNQRTSKKRVSGKAGKLDKRGKEKSMKKKSAVVSKAGKKGTSKKDKSTKTKHSEVVKEVDSSGEYDDIEQVTLPDIVIDPNTVTVDEEDIKAAETYLLKYYDHNTIEETVSCLIETAVANQGRRLEVLECEVICPAIPPNVVLQSNPCVDFGLAPIGTHATKILPIVNIAENTVPVAVTTLGPGEVFTCPVKYRKSSSVKECFEIQSGNTIIQVMAQGRGVFPKLETKPEFLLYVLEAAPGRKAECKVTITNNCEAPLEFFVKQVFLKEGHTLPQTTPEPTNETGEIKAKKKQEKQPKKKPKKDKLQKINTTIDPCISDWLENDFQPIEEQSTIISNQIFTMVDSFTVNPEGNYVLKIFFCPPPLQSAVSEKSQKGSTKSKGKANKTSNKEAKTKSSKGSSKKGKKERKKQEPRSKDLSGNKSRIFAIKYAISLGRLMDVREWVFVGIVKGR